MRNLQRGHGRESLKRGCPVPPESADSPAPNFRFRGANPVLRETIMAGLLLLIGNRKYSSWSLRSWIVLKQAGIKFDEKFVALQQPDTKAKILKYSPSGKVPFLRHGKIEVWESLAICEYLNEAFPKAGLWPNDKAARAHARTVSNEMHA